ncbi:hypothetical protein [Undibacterium luofuense]|nr:hypothetical protein [Undibacterium luofuense]
MSSRIFTAVISKKLQNKTAEIKAEFAAGQSANPVSAAHSQSR